MILIKSIIKSQSRDLTGESSQPLGGQDLPMLSGNPVVAVEVTFINRLEKRDQNVLAFPLRKVNHPDLHHYQMGAGWRKRFKLDKKRKDITVRTWNEIQSGILGTISPSRGFSASNTPGRTGPKNSIGLGKRF